MALMRSEQAKEAIAQRLFAAQRDPRLTSAPTFCNASQTARYTPPVWSVRQGADDHLQCASLQLSAQIERAHQKQKPQVAPTA